VKNSGTCVRSRTKSVSLDLTINIGRYSNMAFDNILTEACSEVFSKGFDFKESDRILRWFIFTAMIVNQALHFSEPGNGNV
jgi:hypothetical protein